MVCDAPRQVVPIPEAAPPPLPANPLPAWRRYAGDVCTGPRAYVKDVRDHFIGMSLGHHANDLLFARTQLNTTASRWSHAHQKIASAIHFRVNQHFFCQASLGVTRIMSMTYDLDQTSQASDYFIHTPLASFCGRFDGDQVWTGVHEHLSDRTIAAVNHRQHRTSTCSVNSNESGWRLPQFTSAFPWPQVVARPLRKSACG